MQEKHGNPTDAVYRRIHELYAYKENGIQRRDYQPENPELGEYLSPLILHPAAKSHGEGIEAAVDNGDSAGDET